MLVLSRRQNEKISFPNLDITVVIRRVACKLVQLGIDAPKSVRVLRDELTPKAEPKQTAAAMRAQHRHGIRDRLNTAMLGIQIAQCRLRNGSRDGLETVLANTLLELQSLNEKRFYDEADQRHETTHGNQWRAGQRIHNQLKLA